MDSFQLIILFIGGIFTGLFSSTVGSGGLVSFPLLLFVGLPIHLALATKSFASIFLELGSTIKFYKEEKLNLKLAVLFGVVASLGAPIGSYLLIGIEGKYLSLITAILMVFIFLTLTFKNKLGILGKKISHRHWVAAIFFTFLLGIYGGFFGVGFGTFITFIFILIGLDFIKSAAVSRVVGLMMSITASVVFAFNGLIHYPCGLAIGMGMGIGGWIGVDLGIKKGNGYIRGLFLVILLATVVKLSLDFVR